ncbi:unnamed protein product [Notodromas monacha]|uniref:OTU domain-containing protein n=1 Tax=Notodromas monacha TaxID=399045 RepID=A0A7R9BRN1_9CRUS|nr:unnamed protein product [Notodromas monacha]CAG0920090.1 unnamed protein product [Notodromas monacha]
MNGQLLKKPMPNDNSCLFTSVYFGIASQADTSAAMELRKVVAGEILDKPEEYSEVILGKPPKEYAEWIRKDQSWGGAIELKILSEYYATEIVMINSQSGHLTRFGEDRSYDRRIFVYYDGIHYDAIYWEPCDNPLGIVTSFPRDDLAILQNAEFMAQEGKRSGNFTDVAKFTLRCLVCKQQLIGQKEAAEHAKKTGEMVFYVTPPAGEIRLEKFYHAAVSRLNFLLDAFAEKSNRVSDNEARTFDVNWLVEGTSKDLVSHFVLRLVCCDDPDLSALLVELEARFFSKRVSHLEKRSLTKLLEKTREEVGSVISWDPRSGGFGDRHYDFYCWAYTALSCFINAWKSNCIPVVPFQTLLSLIATRDVVLVRGEALLDSLEKEASGLLCLFAGLTNVGMSVLKRSRRREDLRIDSVRHEIKRILKRRMKLWNTSPTVGPMLRIRCDDIDHFAKTYFPPCMENLHRTLKHNGRIQYTLFLKEIGLSMDDAFELWKQEYSLPEISCSSNARNKSLNLCGHSWQLNSRKYVGSIRGLYGKTGRCVDYSAHSCTSLQQLIMSGSEVGGCPFVHSDDPELCKFLTNEFGDAVSPSAACATCLSGKLLDIEETWPSQKKAARVPNCDNFSFKKPSQFYGLLRRLDNGQ